jgi:hypothetical protein
METVTWRTAAPFYVQDSGGLWYYRQPALARVHALGAHGSAALLWEGAEAELAEHPAGVELVQSLARQRSATALAAAVA